MYFQMECTLLLFVGSKQAIVGIRALKKKKPSELVVYYLKIEKKKIYIFQNSLSMVGNEILHWKWQQMKK